MPALSWKGKLNKGVTLCSEAEYKENLAQVQNAYDALNGACKFYVDKAGYPKTPVGVARRDIFSALKQSGLDKELDLYKMDSKGTLYVTAFTKEEKEKYLGGAKKELKDARERNK